MTRREELSKRMLELTSELDRCREEVQRLDREEKKKAVQTVFEILQVHGVETIFNIEDGYNGYEIFTNNDIKMDACGRICLDLGVEDKY